MHGNGRLWHDVDEMTRLSRSAMAARNASDPDVNDGHLRRLELASAGGYQSRLPVTRGPALYALGSCFSQLRP
jgi:hypothetical protein